MTSFLKRYSVQLQIKLVSTAFFFCLQSIINAPPVSRLIGICSLLDTLNLCLVFLFRYIFSILDTEEPNKLITGLIKIFYNFFD